MKDTRIIMGMHITVEIVDQYASKDLLEVVFFYFRGIDKQFSTYKEDSEIMKINRGEILEGDYSPSMKEVFALALKTKQETEGYFDIKKADGSLDPSGIVKGWAIQNAADFLRREGIENFYIDAGGDIQSHGLNADGKEWSIGIRNPFKIEEIIKTITVHGQGVATSGSYLRGDHIYNPHMPEKKIDGVVSLTVIGPNILEADRFATAAFAMGKNGISFIEKLDGFEGYSVDSKGVATMTTNFSRFTKTS